MMRNTLIVYHAVDQDIIGLDKYSRIYQVGLNLSSIAGEKWATCLNLGLVELKTSHGEIKNGTIPLSSKLFERNDNLLRINSFKAQGSGELIQLKNNHSFVITCSYHAFQNIDGFTVRWHCSDT